jgi:uncharacterized protein YndB with AHSA1/START domain
MEQTQSDTTVEAPPEDVWEAITDPNQLAEWLGDDVELELEPGGELKLTTAGAERRGFVEEVDAPRRLVFWWSADEADSTRVEIELEPDGEDTRVRVVESRPLAILDRTDSELGSRLGSGASPQLSARAKGPLALVG